MTAYSILKVGSTSNIKSVIATFKYIDMPNLKRERIASVKARWNKRKYWYHWCN
jgi:hypothetical protein